MRGFVGLGLLLAVPLGCIGQAEIEGDPFPLGTSGSTSGGAATGGFTTSESGASTGGFTSSEGGSPTGGVASATGGSATGGFAQAGSSPNGVGGMSTGGAPSGGMGPGDAGDPNVGGMATGSGGAAMGGASTGGKFGGSKGTGGTAPAPDPAAQCSVLEEGAEGSEPNGQIPVCCAPTADEKAVIEQVFELLNGHRVAEGVDPLAYDESLEAAIQGHCLHMATHTFFEHEAPEEAVSSPWTRAETCGTDASGENIAQGQRDAADVMDAWTNSDGHNQNMLNDGFTRVGIGYVASGRYWGQIFGQ